MVYKNTTTAPLLFTIFYWQILIYNHITYYQYFLWVCIRDEEAILCPI